MIIFNPFPDPEKDAPIIAAIGVMLMGLTLILGIYQMVQWLYELLAALLPADLVVPAMVVIVAVIVVLITVVMVWLIKRRIAKLRQAEKENQHEQ